MKNTEQKIYWENRIDRFDAIYDDNEGLREMTLLSKLVEPFRKKSLQERFDLVTDYLREAGIAGKFFVDGGCGAGRMTEFLLVNDAAQVYAVDITSRAIEIAKKRINDRCPDKIEKVHFAVGDISEMNLPVADYLVGLGLVEYLEDIRKFIKNIKSKHVIINYPLKHHWKRLIRMIVEHFEKSTRHYYSPPEIERIFGLYGFRLEKKIPFGASILEVYKK